MTVVQEYESDKFREWTGQPLSVKATGEQIFAPPDISTVWSDKELDDVGLYRTVPFITPQGKIITGEPTYSRSGQNVVETYAIMDAPIHVEDARTATFKADTDVNTLLDKLKSVQSGAEVDAWLASNVTNLAQARTVLGYILKVMVLILQKRGGG